MSNDLIERPNLDKEIQINIESLGKITSNLKEVQQQVLDLNNFYSNIQYTEEQVSKAKEDKAKINKYKKIVQDYIKDIKKKFNEPLAELELVGKDMVTALTETYQSIDTQVTVFENEKKELKANELKEYFEEYAASLGIDFITFDRMGLNVTLSASMKSLKEQITAYLDEVNANINLINSQQYSTEILVEYKQSLNALDAITKVNNRKELLKREEEIKVKQQEEWNQIKDNLEKFKEAALEKPVEENVGDILTTTFTVQGTLEQLKKLKQYIQDNGLEIIKN
jgi:hypothetical protein